MVKMNVALVTLALSSVIGVSANTGMNTTEVLYDYGANNAAGSTVLNGTSAYDAYEVENPSNDIVNRTIYMDATTIGQPYEDRHCVTCGAENEYNVTHTSAGASIANVTSEHEKEGTWAPDFLKNNTISSKKVIINDDEEVIVEEKWEPAFLKDMMRENKTNGEEEITSYTASTLYDSVGSSVNIPAGELYSDESAKLFETIQYIKYRGTSSNSTTFNINNEYNSNGETDLIRTMKEQELQNKKKELLNSDYYLNQEDITIELEQEEVEEPTMREKIITTLSSILLPYAFFMNRNSLTMW